MRRLWRHLLPEWLTQPVPVAAAFAATAVTILAIFIFAYVVPTVHSDSGKLGGGIKQAAPCRAAVKLLGLKKGLNEPECVQQATFIILTCVHHPNCLKPLLKGLLLGLKQDVVIIPKDIGHHVQDQATGGGGGGGGTRPSKPSGPNHKSKPKPSAPTPTKDVGNGNGNGGAGNGNGIGNLPKLPDVPKLATPNPNGVVPQSGLPTPGAPKLH